MSEPQHQKTYFPFTGFLEELRRRGFIIGIDQHLMVRRIIGGLSDQTSVHDLKYILCPLFAVNERQQTIFYKTFDRYYDLAVPKTDISQKEIEDRKEKSDADEGSPIYHSLRFWFLIGLLIVTIIGGSAYQWEERQKTELKPATPPQVVTPPTPTDPKAGKIYTVTLTPPPESQPDIAKIEQQQLKRQWMIVFKSVAVAVPVLFFLIFRLRRYLHKRLVAEKGRGKKPPAVYEFDLKAPEPAFLKTPIFYQTAKNLRRRLKTEGRILDIDKTISATVKSFGFPVFEYRSRTAPAEYLFLINLPELNDHQAGWYETLTDALINEGVYVEKYFYRGDPQVCFQEIGGDTVFLDDLTARYSKHRLILAGTGDDLLDGDGNPEEWIRVFYHWTDRAVLTPEPASEWGMKEVILAKDFIVLPGTLEGVSALSDLFEAPFKYRLKNFIPSDSPQKISDGASAVEILKAHLGTEDAFQWLCACAVWPELHWNLTLYLGSVLFPDSFRDEKSLTALIRVPAFREGRFPDALRLDLIREIEKTKMDKIRKAIINLMENHLPTEATEADDIYRLRLAALRSHRKEQKRIAREVGETRIIRDYTTLKLLETAPKSPLSFEIPKKLHKFFYRRGLPQLGVKTAAVFLFSLILLVLAMWKIEIPPQVELPARKEQVPIEMTFAYIPPWTFWMGQTEEEKKKLIAEVGEKKYEEYYKDELPRHKVTLTKGFYMQTTEVTVGQWRKFIKETGYEMEGGCWVWTGKEWKNNKDNNWQNPGYSQDDNHPATCISWNDIQEFISWLNKNEEGEYRLPTEAEWEYAARAETDTARYWGDDPSQACSYANVADQTAKRKYSNWTIHDCDDGFTETAPVGQFDPNGFGLFDMIGNVWEWCADWYGDYPSGSVTDPTGPGSGSYRVLRGGSWYDYARNCRSADRVRNRPVNRNDGIGFRLVFSPPGHPAR